MSIKKIIKENDTFPYKISLAYQNKMDKKLIRSLIEKIIIQELWSAMPSTGLSISGLSMARNAYGHGGRAQLAGNLNQATQKIVDKEQGEINRNVEDQRWIVRNKYPFTPGKALYNPKRDIERTFQDIEGRPEDKGEFQTAKDVDPVLQERIPSDIFYTDLPGNMRHNAIENPEMHTPPNEIEGHYLIDDIIDELEEEEITIEEDTPVWKVPIPVNNREPEVKKPLGHASLPPAKHTPGPGGASYIPFHKDFVPDEWPQPDKEDEDMDGIDDKIDLDQPPELEKKMDEAKKKNLNPNHRHPKRYETSSATPNATQIGKQFKLANRTLLDLAELLMKTDNIDAMGEITHMVSSLKHIEKQIETFWEAINEEEIEEEFASKAQAGYFFHKAAQGGKEGKKWKKMADEFAADTDFSKLPERAPKKK